MLPVYCPYSMGVIPSGSGLLLNLFPVSRVSRAAQIFVLEFSKDGLADLEDDLTDVRLDNQPVILQGGVGLSSCHVSRCYCQFLQLLRAS